MLNLIINCRYHDSNTAFPLPLDDCGDVIRTTDLTNTNLSCIFSANVNQSKNKYEEHRPLSKRVCLQPKEQKDLLYRILQKCSAQFFITYGEVTIEELGFLKLNEFLDLGYTTLLSVIIKEARSPLQDIQQDVLAAMEVITKKKWKWTSLENKGGHNPLIMSPLTEFPKKLGLSHEKQKEFTKYCTAFNTLAGLDACYNDLISINKNPASLQSRIKALDFIGKLINDLSEVIFPICRQSCRQLKISIKNLTSQSCDSKQFSQQSPQENKAMLRGVEYGIAITEGFIRQIKFLCLYAEHRMDEFKKKCCLSIQAAATPLDHADSILQIGKKYHQGIRRGINSLYNDLVGLESIKVIWSDKNREISSDAKSIVATHFEQVRVGMIEFCLRVAKDLKIFEDKHILDIEFSKPLGRPEPFLQLSNLLILLAFCLKLKSSNDKTSEQLNAEIELQRLKFHKDDAGFFSQIVIYALSAFDSQFIIFSKQMTELYQLSYRRCSHMPPSSNLPISFNFEYIILILHKIAAECRDPLMQKTLDKMQNEGRCNSPHSSTQKNLDKTCNRDSYDSPIWFLTMLKNFFVQMAEGSIKLHWNSENVSGKPLLHFPGLYADLRLFDVPTELICSDLLRFLELTCTGIARTESSSEVDRIEMLANIDVNSEKKERKERSITFKSTEILTELKQANEIENKEYAVHFSSEPSVKSPRAQLSVFLEKMQPSPYETEMSLKVSLFNKIRNHLQPIRLIAPKDVLKTHQSPCEIAGLQQNWAFDNFQLILEMLGQVKDAEAQRLLIMQFFSYGILGLEQCLTAKVLKQECIIDATGTPISIAESKHRLNYWLQKLNLNSEKEWARKLQRGTVNLRYPYRSQGVYNLPGLSLITHDPSLVDPNDLNEIMQRLPFLVQEAIDIQIEAMSDDSLNLSRIFHEEFTKLKSKCQPSQQTMSKNTGQTLSKTAEEALSRSEETLIGTCHSLLESLGDFSQATSSVKNMFYYVNSLPRWIPLFKQFAGEERYQHVLAHGVFVAAQQSIESLGRTLSLRFDDELQAHNIIKYCFFGLDAPLDKNEKIFLDAINVQKGSENIYGYFQKKRAKIKEKSRIMHYLSDLYERAQTATDNAEKLFTPRRLKSKTPSVIQEEFIKHVVPLNHIVDKLIKHHFKL